MAGRRCAIARSGKDGRVALTSATANLSSGQFAVGRPGPDGDGPFHGPRGGDRYRDLAAADYERGLREGPRRLARGLRQGLRGSADLATKIGAKDVLIDGRPLVPLGGDFWHTPYPIGQNGTSLIRVVTKVAGILDSSPFSISRRWLAFRLGGSAGGAVALELRIPAATAKAKKRKALDKPDADGYVAVRLATPSGSDPLTRDRVGPVRQGGEDEPAGLGGQDPPPSQRRARARSDCSSTTSASRRSARRRSIAPLWGWADIHCHPMAQAGFGDLLAGHMHGPVEDLGSCLELHGHEHGNLLRPTAFALGEHAPQRRRRSQRPAGRPRCRTRTRSSASTAGPSSTRSSTSRRTRTGSAAPTTAASG